MIAPLLDVGLRFSVIMARLRAVAVEGGALH